MNADINCVSFIVYIRCHCPWAVGLDIVLHVFEIRLYSAIGHPFYVAIISIKLIVFSYLKPTSLLLHVPLPHVYLRTSVNRIQQQHLTDEEPFDLFYRDQH